MSAIANAQCESGKEGLVVMSVKDSEMLLHRKIVWTLHNSPSIRGERKMGKGYVWKVGECGGAFHPKKVYIKTAR